MGQLPTLCNRVYNIQAVSFPPFAWWPCGSHRATISNAQATPTAPSPTTLAPSPTAASLTTLPPSAPSVPQPRLPLAPLPSHCPGLSGQDGDKEGSLEINVRGIKKACPLEFTLDLPHLPAMLPFMLVILVKKKLLARTAYN